MLLFLQKLFNVALGLGFAMMQSTVWCKEQKDNLLLRIYCFFPPESPHVISLTKDSEFMIPFHSVRDFVENSLKLQTRMYVELVSLRSEVEQVKRNGISHPVMDNLDCIAGDKLQPKDSYSAPQSNDVKACHEILIPRYPSFPAEWEKLGEKNIADAFKAYYKYQMHRAEKKSKKASKAFSDIKTVVE